MHSLTGIANRVLRSGGTFRWNLFRWPASASLMGASALKGWQLISLPVMPPGMLHGRVPTTLTSVIELVLSVRLLLKPLDFIDWLLTTLLWTVFLMVSSGESFVGADSCGCFGFVSVPPIYTAVFDAGMLVVLIGSRPAISEHTDRARKRGKNIATVLTILGATLVALVVTGLQAEASDRQGIVVADGRIFLEPTKWVGRRFPLLPYLVHADEIRTGDWTLLFYRSDCSICEPIKRDFQQVSGQADTTIASSIGLALVDFVSSSDERPVGGSVGTSDRRIQKLRLQSGSEWIVQTPFLVRLHDGDVVRVYPEPDHAAIFAATR
jgi:hypothetical protein